MTGKNEIVFEDLRGRPDPDDALVDLDADADKGITRVAAEEREQESKPNGREREEREAPAEEEGERRRLDAEDEGAGDDDDYPAKVRKRIEREVKAKKRVEDDRDYWKEQAESAQQRLAEQRKAATKETVEAIDAQITQTEAELVRVLEEGKSEEQVKLMSKLTDLKAKKITTEIAVQNDGGSDNRTEDGRVRSSGGPTKLAREWMAGQSDWYGKPGFERQSRIANRLDKELFAEGYDPNDPEYFTELDRRLKRDAPELYGRASGRDDDDDRSGRGDDDRRSRRSPVAGVGGDGGGGRDRPSNRVQLTREDFANMKLFNLDTNDPEVLKEYARNKREADNDERNQNRGGRR